VHLTVAGAENRINDVDDVEEISFGWKRCGHAQHFQLRPYCPSGGGGGGGRGMYEVGRRRSAIDKDCRNREAVKTGVVC